VLIGMMARHPEGRVLDLAGGRGEMARRVATTVRPVIVLEPSLEKRCCRLPGDNDQ
jgi:ubiquinone/menaquinone biosynthesis C-methylase UbiE